jgi:hypothetical protein
VSLFFYDYAKMLIDEMGCLFLLFSETSVFAYLGLGIFSFPHRLEPALVIWSIVLCLLGKPDKDKVE